MGKGRFSAAAGRPADNKDSKAMKILAQGLNIHKFPIPTRRAGMAEAFSDDCNLGLDMAGGSFVEAGEDGDSMDYGQDTGF
jgi:hypothetical protein